MFFVGSNGVEPGELLWQDDFTDPDLSKRWEISRGEWTSGDGVCRGLFRTHGGGLIYSLEQMPEGDIMLDYYGKILGPCENDLNFAFRTRGWDYSINDADKGYIGGLAGWYVNRSGIEKYPGCHLYALTEAFKAEPDREYHIQTGIIGTTAFLVVDGVVLVTMNDPEPINDPDCNRVGIGTFCSWIEVRDFKVYRPKLTPQRFRYTPKF